jgi:hypothetical protein
MSGRKKTVATICVVDLRGEEMQIFCEDCLSLLGKGLFCVGVIVDDRRFLVEHNPSLECCDKVRQVPLLYDTEVSAKHMQQEILTSVTIERNLDGLILQDITHGVKSATRH